MKVMKVMKCVSRFDLRFFFGKGKKGDGKDEKVGRTYVGILSPESTSAACKRMTSSGM